jgi:hypothetical protein
MVDHNNNNNGITQDGVELGDITPSTTNEHVAANTNGSMVDVASAVAEFKKLEDDIHAAQRATNVENQGGAAEWDIHEFFEDSVRHGEQTGHKLKRMGVVAKNLTVVGMGADADTIPDNLDIIKVLWPGNWYVKHIHPHPSPITHQSANRSVILYNVSR